MNSNLDLVVDLELTHFESGVPMWLGALLVNRDTEVVVGELELFAKVPDKAVFSELGAAKYNSNKHISKGQTLKNKCTQAPSLEEMGQRFLSFARPTETSPIPRLCGYNHKKLDLPAMLRCFNLPPTHWLATCDQLDVLRLACIYWPKETGRSLANVAQSLAQADPEFGKRIEGLTCHHPLDDCKLTLQCKKMLEFNLNHHVPAPPLIKFEQNEEDLEEVDTAPVVTTTETTTFLESHAPAPKPRKQKPWANSYGHLTTPTSSPVTYEEATDWYARHALIKCPVCGAAARLCMVSSCRGVLDDFFWQCTNANHKNTQPKSFKGVLLDQEGADTVQAAARNFTFNVDGTQFHKPLCDVRQTLVLPQPAQT